MDSSETYKLYSGKIKWCGCLIFLTILLASCSSAKPTPERPESSEPPLSQSEFFPKKESDTSSAHSASALPGFRHSQEVEENNVPILIHTGDAYTFEHPVLMGLSIGDSYQTVMKHYGREMDQYIMHDPTDPITVLNYSSFTVGLDIEGLVRFINIESNELDPGLSGIRIGSHREAIRSAFGQPATETSFVLTYRSNGTVLKLDIDPADGLIQSIKLFADLNTY